MFLKPQVILPQGERRLWSAKENDSVDTRCTYRPRFEDDHVGTSLNPLGWTPLSVWENRGQKGEGGPQIHSTASAEVGPRLSFQCNSQHGNNVEYLSSL